MKKKLLNIAALIITTIITQANSPFQAQELIAPEPQTSFSEKEVVEAQEYMVVTAHPLATEAGFKALQKGGNAIDAAIAAQMVLNVVEPYASGIGGGGFLLYYDADSRTQTFFNGRETAPFNIDPNLFQDKKGNPKDFREALKGGASVGTPGVLKMLKKAHDAHGKLPWFELFSDAIDTASLGFNISERLVKVVDYAPHIKEFKKTKKMFFNRNNSKKEEGELIYNNELANTFREIALNGIDSFYEGYIAENIVNAVQHSKVNPGYLSKKDLTSYEAKTDDLICRKYRKYKICSVPMPSSGGVTMLQAMGIIENFDISQMTPNSEEAIHVISEATRLAFADRNKYAADSDFIDVPIAQMLDKKYLKSRSFLINVDASLLDVTAGYFVTKDNVIEHQKIYEPPSTTHLSIIDKEGNAVSFTSSIEFAFGSGITINGFLLNNQLTDFSFISEKDGKLIANRIEGGKRPRSSMTPSFVFDDKGRLILIVGSPGGARIIPYVIKTLVAVLDWELPPQKAVDLPNFAKMNDTLELEEGSDLESLAEKLENIGHKVKIRDLASGIHAIFIDKKTIYSGVDKRREGSAMGF